MGSANLFKLLTPEIISKDHEGLFVSLLLKDASMTCQIDWTQALWKLHVIVKYLVKAKLLNLKITDIPVYLKKNFTHHGNPIQVYRVNQFIKQAEKEYVSSVKKMQTN